MRCRRRGGRRSELYRIADGNDVVGIERAEHQSVSMEVAKSVEDGIEDFARFLSIERRSRLLRVSDWHCFKRREYPSVE